MISESNYSVYLLVHYILWQSNYPTRISLWSLTNGTYSRYVIATDLEITPKQVQLEHSLYQIIIDDQY